jgi:hypothetical protein
LYVVAGPRWKFNETAIMPAFGRPSGAGAGEAGALKQSRVAQSSIPLRCGFALSADNIAKRHRCWSKEWAMTKKTRQ